MNNIYLFGYESFMVTVEKALINFVLSEYNKLSKKNTNDNKSALKNNYLKFVPKKE